jgi:hypothetical protein
MLTDTKGDAIPVRMPVSSGQRQAECFGNGFNPLPTLFTIGPQIQLVLIQFPLSVFLAS